jgi:hypothetical protein
MHHVHPDKAHELLLLISGIVLKAHLCYIGWAAMPGWRPLWSKLNLKLNCSQVAPNRGLKKGCPLSPLLYSLYYNEIDRFLTVQRGAATALDQLKSLTVIMLMTLLSLQTRLKICNSNWTNSMTIHVSKGSSSTLTTQKSWSSSAAVTLRFPPSRTLAHL